MARLFHRLWWQAAFQAYNPLWHLINHDSLKYQRARKISWLFHVHRRHEGWLPEPYETEIDRRLSRLEAIICKEHENG